MYIFNAFQGMIALRRQATTVTHEDFMDAIMEVQAKKKANLNYYAWGASAAKDIYHIFFNSHPGVYQVLKFKIVFSLYF